MAGFDRADMILTSLEQPANKVQHSTVVLRCLDRLLRTNSSKVVQRVEHTGTCQYRAEPHVAQGRMPNNVDGSTPLNSESDN